MSADYGLTPTPNTSDPDPLAKSQAVARLLAGGRRHRRADHPRRDALRVQLHPERRLRRNAARRRRGRLVHDRMVRQVREGRRERRQAAADESLALATRWRPPIDPNHDGNMFSFYYPLTPGHRAGRRRAVHVREPAGRLRGLVTDDGRPAATRTWRSRRRPTAPSKRGLVPRRWGRYPRSTWRQHQSQSRPTRFA